MNDDIGHVLKKERVQHYKSAFSIEKGDLVLTPNHLMFFVKKGLLSKKEVTTIDIPIPNILNVKATKGFGYGVEFLNVLFKDEKGKEKTVKFRNISLSSTIAGSASKAQPLYFADWEAAIEEQRKVYNKQETGDYSNLEKLAQLKDKGIITEEEFQAKKKQLLGL